MKTVALYAYLPGYVKSYISWRGIVQGVIPIPRQPVWCRLEHSQHLQVYAESLPFPLVYCDIESSTRGYSNIDLTERLLGCWLLILKRKMSKKEFCLDT